MKPDEHLYISAEITTESHKAAVHLLRDILSTVDHQSAHPDEDYDGTWSNFQGSARLQMCVRKDRVEPSDISREHELKTDPDVFDAVDRDEKPFEIRRNDRDFKVADVLFLRRTLFTGAEMKAGKPLIYTGESTRRAVTYILNGPRYGLAEGWCIMGITRRASYSTPMVESLADVASRVRIINEDVALNIGQPFKLAVQTLNAQISAALDRYEVEKKTWGK